MGLRLPASRDARNHASSELLSAQALRLGCAKLTPPPTASEATPGAVSSPPSCPCCGGCDPSSLRGVSGGSRRTRKRLEEGEHTPPCTPRLTATPQVCFGPHRKDSYTSGGFTGGSSTLTGGSAGFCSSSCQGRSREEVRRSPAPRREAVGAQNSVLSGDVPAFQPPRAPTSVRAAGDTSRPRGRAPSS